MIYSLLISWSTLPSNPNKSMVLQADGRTPRQEVFDHHHQPRLPPNEMSSSRELVDDLLDPLKHHCITIRISVSSLKVVSNVKGKPKREPQEALPMAFSFAIPIPIPQSSLPHHKQNCGASQGSVLISTNGSASMSDGLWTARMIGQVIHSKFAVNLRKSSVCRLLTQLGLTLQRPVW